MALDRRFPISGITLNDERFTIPLDSKLLTQHRFIGAKVGKDQIIKNPHCTLIMRRPQTPIPTIQETATDRQIRMERTAMFRPSEREKRQYPIRMMSRLDPSEPSTDPPSDPSPPDKGIHQFLRHLVDLDPFPADDASPSP